MYGSRSARFSPLQQGNLDGLCGVYSILNATRCVTGPINDQEARNLFLSIIDYLHAKKGSLQFFVDGISIHDIGSVLRDIVEPNYSVIRTKPFAKKGDVGLANFWEHMSEFLSRPSRAIILGLTGKYDHWTVAKSITENRLTLLDSDRLYWINRGAVTTGTPTARRAHGIPPNFAYFLVRK